VWIYGVGFDSTFSNVNGYDGVIQALRGDVIVVTIQYRLGALGFLALDDTIAPGNNGLLDQQLALQWIHDHIAAFGGDPGSVTLVGQSAGGTSVSLHLLSNGSSALFRSAVIQSHVATAPITFHAVDQLRQSSRALADLFGCETKNRRQSISDLVTCLRGVSAADLIEKEWAINTNGPPFAPRFGPTVDGTFLTNPPGDLINAGQFQRKNILLGVNSDEAGCFQYGAYRLQGVYYGQNLTADVYKLMTNDMLSWANSGQMVAVNFEYTTACQTDGISSPNYFKAIDSIVNDYFFQCPVVNLALAYARQIQLEADTTNSVYFYKFAYRDTFSASSTWANGALQGDELDFLFGRPWNPDFALNYTDRERTLSSKVIEFWTNFAKTGDPNLYDVNGDRQTSDEWPKYTANERLVLVLDTTDHLQTQMGLRDRECEFWTNVVPNLGAAPPKSEGARLVCRNSPVSILFVSISVVLRWFSRQ
jgi:acetylcholinesterase